MHKLDKNFLLTELLLLSHWIFIDFALVGLKTHRIGRIAKHWHSGAPPDVVDPGTVFETQVSIQGPPCAS